MSKLEQLRTLTKELSSLEEQVRLLRAERDRLVIEAHQEGISKTEIALSMGNGSTANVSRILLRRRRRA